LKACCVARYHPATLYTQQWGGGWFGNWYHSIFKARRALIPEPLIYQIFTLISDKLLPSKPTEDTIKSIAMKLAIMQPYIFPYAGYFHLLASVDKFICLDNVNFIKKGWINRNRILLNGNAWMFTIPVTNISQNRPINEHFISEHSNWESDLLRTIEGAYKYAPFFHDIFPVIQRLIQQEEKNIARFNYNCLKEICSYLSITTELTLASSDHNKLELRPKQDNTNLS